ncbi:MAG: translation elongation factor-like protein [Archaeoglobaceae archaeon]
MEEVGRISHYFNKIGVAAIVLNNSLNVGDKVRIKGNKTDLVQNIDSMEIDKKKIERAMPGDTVGIKVADKVRRKDKVYRLD